MKIADVYVCVQKRTERKREREKDSGNEGLHNSTGQQDECLHNAAYNGAC